MTTVYGQTLHNTRISLDNSAFVDCTMTNCVLEYSGEPVSFHRTRFTGCKYIFVGPAKRTVLFLQETGLLPFDPAEWGEFGDDAAADENDGAQRAN